MTCLCWVELILILLLRVLKVSIFSIQVCPCYSIVKEQCNELYAIIDALKWIKKEMSGDVPQAQSSAYVVTTDGTRIITFAGILNGHACNDTFVMDTGKKRLGLKLLWPIRVLKFICHDCCTFVTSITLYMFMFLIIVRS